MALSPISLTPLPPQALEYECAAPAIPRTVRVLQVINSLLIGGAERSLVAQCLILRELGCHVDVCTLYHDGPFARPLRQAGVEIHNLALDPGIARFELRKKYDPRGIFGLARLVKTGRYDIVHAHLFPAGMFASFALGVLGRPPLVFSEHSVSNRRRRKLYWWLDRLVYSRYDAVIAVSPEVASSLRKWLPNVKTPVEVVPNGIHWKETAGSSAEDQKGLRQSLEIPQAAKVVLFAGRLEHPKGPDVLIRALPMVLEQDPAVRVLLAGDGPLRSACASLIQRLHLDGRATLLGARSDVPRLMELADVVVLPSRREGLPMTLLEAMAAGKAVVATSVGAMPALIDESTSGWIVDPESPRGLAKGLVEALSQEGERTSRGRNGMRVVREKYSAEKSAASLLRIYRDLI